MRPFYFFGWSELARDMEAENFFVYDTEKDDVQNLIKVYPSLDTKTDIKRTYRDV